MILVISIGLIALGLLGGYTLIVVEICSRVLAKSSSKADEEFKGEQSDLSSQYSITSIEKMLEIGGFEIAYEELVTYLNINRGKLAIEDNVSIYSFKSFPSLMVSKSSQQVEGKLIIKVVDSE